MKTFLSSSDDFGDPDVAAAHRIGLSVAKGFDWQGLDEPTKRRLARAAITAQAIIDDTYANAAEIVSGWRYTMGGGRRVSTTPCARRWLRTSPVPTFPRKS
jgi:hypothetical protein